MDDTIYLDHAATTPLDPDVLAAMLPYFTERYGNPSSIYQLGQEARAAVDRARIGCARVLGCEPGEIIFTSGATESDNLALRGVAWGARLALPDDAASPHIVTTAIEHHAVLHTAQALEREGFTATYVLPDSRGIVDPEAIAAAVRPETCLISVMYANNESGAIQPLQEIADDCARSRHCLAYRRGAGRGHIALECRCSRSRFALAFGSQVLWSEGRRLALRTTRDGDRVSAKRGRAGAGPARGNGERTWHRRPRHGAGTSRRVARSLRRSLRETAGPAR